MFTVHEGSPPKKVANLLEEPTAQSLRVMALEDSLKALLQSLPSALLAPTVPNSQVLYIEARRLNWGFPKLGYFFGGFGGPHDMDWSIFRSYFGIPLCMETTVPTGQMANRACASRIAVPGQAREQDGGLFPILC